MQHAVFLNETARVPEPRFIPQTHEQYLSAVYTLWNLLDHPMYQHRSKRPVYPYGYMRLVQLKAYSRLVWRNPTARTYCETGVNGGHGTAAMLLANPNLVAHSFDPGEQPYSDEVFKILSVYFGPRFILHRGSSHVHLPKSVADLAGKCDVLLVDGDHTASGAHQDIVDFKALAACRAWVLLDDTSGSRVRGSENSGPGRALERAAASGLLEITERHDYRNNSVRENPCLRHKNGGAPVCFAPWGWALARYRGCET